MNGMISSIDFAKYILKCVKTLNEKRSEPITMNETKLHKLMYICDGLLLASNKNVINETAHAWNYGPVYPKVHVWVSKNKPFNSNIDVPQNVVSFLESIKAEEVVMPVIERMGVYTAGQLSNWSHRPGSPWEKALERNNGIMNGIINKKDMKEYFSRQENND